MGEEQKSLSQALLECKAALQPFSNGLKRLLEFLKKHPLILVGYCLFVIVLCGYEIYNGAFH